MSEWIKKTLLLCKKKKKSMNQVSYEGILKVWKKVKSNF